MDRENHKSLENVHGSIDTAGKKSPWKRLLAFLGPAYLVSVGYMDPGNWATDIAGGSQFGYALLWVLLMSNIMALLLQSLCTRLGIVRGLDLAQASRQSYPRFVNFILYLLAEIAIAATDLAEVTGMAIGLNLLFGLPMIWGVSITVLDSFLLLFLINRGMRRMEAFIIALIAIIQLGGKEAKYKLIHIVETRGALIYGETIDDRETLSDEEFLISYKRELEEQGYQVFIELGFGSPKKAIPKILNKENFDLLVMGSHGHKMFKDLIFGTTVDSVRHQVKMPVFIA